jgi:ABC-2 type transport system permease protein
MMADTWLLLGLRWQTAWNGFRHARAWRQALTILAMVAVAVGLGSFSAAVGVLFGEILRHFPTANLDALLPGVLLTIVAVILLLSSFGLALGSLFLSSDLELLMSAPVDRRAVFLSKILDGMGTNYGILAVTALPALVAYGIGIGYGPLYYLFAIIAVIGTPLLPAALGALLVLVVARFAPARRVREVLGLMAALFGISCSILGQTSRLWMQKLDSFQADPTAFKAQIAAIADLPIPTLVAGRGLRAAGNGDLAGALVGMAGFLVLTFGLFALGVVVADRMYASGWVRMQSSGSAQRSRKRVARDAANAGWLGRAPAYLAIALKDWRVMPRDLRNFAQIIGPLVMLPGIYFNLLGGGGRRSFNAAAELNSLTGGRVDPTGIFIAMGVLMATSLLATQISATAISMEGKSWWLLKAAPISSLELVRGKFLAAALPFAVLSSVLMIVAMIWKQFSVFGFLYGWFGVELLGFGVLAMSLGFAMRWPRLDWDNPKQMRNGWANLASLAGDAVLGLLGGGLLLVPILAEIWAPAWVLPAWIIGIGGAVGITVGLAWTALAIGLDHLPEVGEA